MTEKTKQKGLMMVVACLVFYICFISAASGQERIPVPGTKIDKSNIAQYKHLFPEGFDRVFIDGYGLMRPLSITVKKTEPIKWLKEEKEATQNNHGKYQLDAEGYIDAFYGDISGQPFPNVDPSEQQFCKKLMWNYSLRYNCDTMKTDGSLIMYKRKGERISLMLVSTKALNMKNRLFDNPKPYWKNPSEFAILYSMRISHPPINRNLLNMSWRYVDPRKDNTTFAYVPSLRRVLRADTGEKSTPQANSTMAPDDQFIFDGRMPEFTFKFLGEQKVLAVAHAKPYHWNLDTAIQDVAKLEDFPVQTDTWEVRDVYVIEVRSVFLNYPQSKKIIYIDKEYPVAYFGNAYDRAGDLWKIWYVDRYDTKIRSGDNQNRQYGQVGLDIQMGFTDYMINPTEKVNGWSYKPNDFSTVALRQQAR